MHQSASSAKKAKLDASGKTLSLTEHYMDQLKHVPGVSELIGDKGMLIPGSVKSTADYSYFATRYSGEHFRIIGDAASRLFVLFYQATLINLTRLCRSILFFRSAHRDDWCPLCRNNNLCIYQGAGN